MTDTADKPTLKDIPDKDSGQDSPVDAPLAGASPVDDPLAKDDAAPKPEAQRKGGGGFVWFVVVLAIAGGAIAAGWPYIGPRVEPVISDMRALLGLTPRPTQARLPSEASSVVDSAPLAETPAETPVQAPGEAADESAPMPEIPADAPVQIPGSAPDQAMTASEAATDVADISRRLEVLESQIGTLGTISGVDATAALDATAELTNALTGLKTEVAGLSARVQALEEGPRADPTAPAQALVLGVTQLRARLTGDSPFAAELMALEQIAAGDATVLAALQRLKPHADVGVPSEAALTARFSKVAQAIISARSTSEAGGWLGAVKDKLGGLVTVRRTNPAAITDQVERAVAVAEAALELGELGEAVKALSELQGAPGDAAAAWLGDAHARVDAEAALEDLHSHALAVLSAAGGA